MREWFSWLGMVLQIFFCVCFRVLANDSVCFCVWNPVWEARVSVCFRVCANVFVCFGLNWMTDARGPL